MTVRRAKLDIDALFVLDCGCILDGCSGSHPARAFLAGVRGGVMMCTAAHPHQRVVLLDVVLLNVPAPLSSPPPEH